MQDFSKCESCGIIFHNPDGQHTTCSRCRESSDSPASEQDELRQLKNLLRDMRARGEYPTVVELSKQTGVSEDRIWGYIRSGEIDTASLDDPKVRDYLLRKRVEQAKAAQRQRGESAQPAEAPAERPSGFHHKKNDDKRH
jgi:hypothetical protein